VDDYIQSLREKDKHVHYTGFIKADFKKYRSTHPLTSDIPKRFFDPNYRLPEYDPLAPEDPREYEPNEFDH
jgi:hypothetical protein